MAKQPGLVDDFYDRFDQNCDRAGTPLLEVLRQFFKNLLVFGRAAILVDLPPKGDFKNLKEERDAGQFEPFLVNYDPRQMINYRKDENGKLEWAMFSARQETATTPFAAPQVTDDWYYFDRQNFAHYRRVVPLNEKTTPDNAQAEKILEGPHALNAKGVVPVIYVEVPKGLWLVNRAYSVAKNHLNTTNALDWALYMACLAMPVVKMDGDYEVTLSEAGFIKLPKDADYSWAEPEGKSFEQMQKRVENLCEQVFRAFYLIAQSRSTSATASSQSGVSKQQDAVPSKKILNLFGDVMRAVTQAIYNYVSTARGDSYAWDVRGLNFPEGPPSEEIDTVAGAQAIGVPSIAFEKELYKKVVMATIPDMNPKLKEEIFDQIDKAPSAADAEVEQLKKRAQVTMAKDVFPGGAI